MSKDISIITYTLSVPREFLNIVASGRGIVCGRMVIEQHGMLEEISNEAYFNLPTAHSFVVRELLSKRILVVEKESIFLLLMQVLANYPEYMIVTSKGYPDYITQKFLREIAQMDTQIYYIGDMDPFGFDILLQYAVGNGF